MHVNDFPKKGTGSSECLTVITITTEPPLVSHGSGVDSVASRDEAALQVAAKVQELMSEQERGKEDSGLESEEDKNSTNLEGPEKSQTNPNKDSSSTTTIESNACDNLSKD